MQVLLKMSQSQVVQVRPHQPKIQEISSTLIITISNNKWNNSKYHPLFNNKNSSPLLTKTCLVYLMPLSKIVVQTFKEIQLD